MLQDLGLNPRSPHYFTYFVFPWSSLYTRPRTTIHPHNPTSQVLGDHIWWLSGEDPSKALVKAKHWIQQVNNGSIPLGPDCYSHSLQITFPGPISLYLFFLYFVLFNLFIYFTNKINYFFYQKIINNIFHPIRLRFTFYQ